MNEQIAVREPVREFCRPQFETRDAGQKSARELMDRLSRAPQDIIFGEGA